MEGSSAPIIPPADRDETLMQATYRALCEHGYDDLTMSNIADEFDKSPSLINYRYGTKDQLILTLLTYLVDSGREIFGEIEADDPTTRLESFIDRFLFGPDEESLDFQEFITALHEFTSQASHNEAYRDQLDEFRQVGIESLQNIIQDGIDDGSFNNVDPERTASLLYGAMTDAHNERISLGHEEAPQRTRQAIEELILADLRR